MVAPILEVKHLDKTYSIKRGLFRKPALLKAVHDVSFSVFPGETVSIVGESGCGKSTLGKLILQIEAVTSGNILFHNKEITHLDSHLLKEYWKRVQIIFQNPYSSLNPRWKVGKIIGEPFYLHTNYSSQDIKERVVALMDKVGLHPEHYDRYPHQFSGGQRQRIGIARTLCLQPDLLVCDEPVSALDVSVQSQVLNLLMDLQETHGSNLTFLFISHDLGVVEHISDRILVMYLGKLVEVGTREQIFSQPKHPYTQALLSAIPKMKPGQKKEQILLSGDVPSPIDPPSGCSFRTRCPFAKEDCVEVDMSLIEVEEEHFTACPF